MEVDAMLRAQLDGETKENSSHLAALCFQR